MIRAGYIVTHQAEDSRDRNASKSPSGLDQRKCCKCFGRTLAVMVETELRSKLDPAAMVSLEALWATDEDSRSRAVARRVQAFKVLSEASVNGDEARTLAGLK